MANIKIKPKTVDMMSLHCFSWTFILVALITLTACQQLPEGTVETKQGTLAGMEGETPGTYVYKGVPFAAPPVGEGRWKAPQPPASWDGIRQATAFSDACVQNLQRSRAPWTEPFMHQGDASEDCLYLNIWTKAREGDALPVLVYIHGGGFGEGSGSVDVYNGEALAQKELVVVTINYRLGVLGYLAHADLAEESPQQASGNYGMLDQVAALEWIQQNIASFGGDPGNVTIAGQSAGAMSVYLLTASPLAAGLFHRAIVQSGPGGLASFGLVSTHGVAALQEVAEADGAAFATAKGAASIADLRAMRVEELTTPTEGDEPMRFRPIIDGYFLTDDLAAVYEAGNQNDTPMLSGFNADEGSAFPGYGQLTADALKGMVEAQYGVSADAFMAHYPVSTNEQAGEAQVMSGRELAAVALHDIAQARAVHAQTPEYIYYFERGIPWPSRPEFGAFHTAEVPYVFNNLKWLDRPWEEMDHELADRVSSYWAHFARNGDPNGAGLPEWPAYQDAPYQVMVLGANPAVADMPASEERRTFLQTVVRNANQ